DPIALNSLARQVPLLSSPGAIEQVLTRAPEFGGGLAATFEPGQTILRIAAQLEGLPQRAGAHPSAYAVSFLGPGALSWLPALWVSADRRGASASVVPATWPWLASKTLTPRPWLTPARQRPTWSLPVRPAMRTTRLPTTTTCSARPPGSPVVQCWWQRSIRP